MADKEMTTKKEKKQKGKKAILLVGSSEQDSNMYWATGFLAPDPFVYIEIDKKKILIADQLEFDRAKLEAKVNRVIHKQRYGEKKGIKKIQRDEMITLFLKDLEINTVLVPGYFPTEISDMLRNNSFSVQTKQEPFFEQRNIKTKQEIQYITEVQRAVENVLKKTLKIIKKSEIKDGLLYHSKKPLTSEYLRNFIRIELLKKNCWCEADVIVSCGAQTAIPHKLGTGQLTANSPIILDVFPRSLETKYWADMTRTVVKGKASNEFKKLYYTVLRAQKIGIEMIKPGVDTFDIHQAVKNYFESKGYKTGKINGQEQGFIHSTGHGVGLDIHEYPMVTSGDGEGKGILETGNVITIEPGLYYAEIGGVRIEDMRLVTKNGSHSLTNFPKEKLMEL